MGELIDKAKGIGNEIAGNAKQAQGEATNNPDKKAEGLGQEIKGKAQQIKGSIKGALGDKV
ncbi:CsbD family protein [Sphingobium sp. H33]|uniref:CsbD family protein n=2 Tax=Sphingobium nicotianae TaxID=2782607 RepID=A0A9X1D9E3_9SPHN|nr:CsbD family protein [Sphingobium nicotianae]MBT2185511.1 CsbD family protein [Sphingobium nicotianae]